MSGSVHTQYSCACLNVRIVPVPQDADPPATAPPSPDFCPVHVSDEGISVAHPQVTLRIRTRGELTSRNHRARYTSLTCLLCRILVYRVHQIVSLDADARDGPLMPTEDWVEQDILKSPSGWIEVHKQCLTGDAIARVEASSQYSTLFSLAIPLPASPLASPQPSVEDGPQMSYLAHLPPLFLPPPFTPAHPVFVHLAALAKTESQAHRTALETYMAEVMRAKTAELARTEALLRSQVETVWRRFRKGLMAIEPHPDTGALASPRSPRSPAPGAPGTPASPTIAGTPLAVVRDFVPQPVASAARALHSAAPVVSSLSASLATSAFHHPRAQQQQQQHTPASPPARPASMISSSSRTLSGGSVTLAGSPRPVPLRAYDEGASVLQFGRTTDDTINTAASYQFFRTLEEDMARSRREQQLKKGAVVTAASADAGPSTVNGKGKGKAGAEKNGAVGSAPNDAPHAEGTVDDAGVRDKGKGKQRKVVTFESQPDVVTIKREVNAEKEEEARRARDDGEEMIFVLEADGKERDAASAETPVLMLVEPTAQPRTSRPRRQTRKGGATDSTGLPQSFSGLRPASLPVPSKIVPRRRASRGSESPQNDGAATIQEEDGAEEEGEEEEEEEEEEGEDEEYDSRDVQILKLVAANTPSHRGAWKKDSAAWKSLVSRDSRTSDADDEEDDGGARPPAYTNGSSQAGMPGSMPIAIRPLVKPQTNLSLASYRPQTLPALPQELEEPEPPVPVSSSSVRKAVYAERDRSRLMDPGALDFAADDEEEEEEDDDDEDEDDRSDGAVGSASGGERAPKVRGGRKRALKILRARNELPDSGMWRSLAS